MLLLSILFCILFNTAKLDIVTKSTRTVSPSPQIAELRPLFESNASVLIDSPKPFSQRETIGPENKTDLRNMDINRKDDSSPALFNSDNTNRNQSITQNPNPPLHNIDTNQIHLQPTLKSKIDDTDDYDASAKKSPFEQTQDCDMSFKNLLFEKYNEEHKPALPATKIMREQCKDMKYSCCSQKELVALFEVVVDDSSFYKKKRLALKKFTEYIKTVSDSLLDDFRDNANSKYKKCDNNSKINIIEAIKTVKDKSEMVFLKLNDYLYNSIISMFDFACAICAYENNSFFKVTPNERTFYNVTIKYPDEILNFFNRQFDFFFMDHFIVLVNFFECYTFIDHDRDAYNDNDDISDDDYEHLPSEEGMTNAVKTKDIQFIVKHKFYKKYFSSYYMPGMFTFANFDILKEVMAAALEESEYHDATYKRDYIITLVGTYNFKKKNPLIADFVIDNVSIQEKKKGYNSKLFLFSGINYTKIFREVLQINGFRIVPVAIMAFLATLWQ